MRIKKNGKVINLTESDLKRIVKKVLNESERTTLNANQEKMGKHLFKDGVQYGIEVGSDGKNYFWVTSAGLPKDIKYPLRDDGSMLDFNSLISSLNTYGKHLFKNDKVDGDALNDTVKSMIQTARKSDIQVPD
tara:strand:- start:484 stop:882 length:399 start_codon:yes stop_codon:yes gene_type:complete